MMRVQGMAGDVVFLHEVAEGAAGRSWGVHVARLAGVPAPVVRRAGALLAALETRRARHRRRRLPLFAAADGAAAADRAAAAAPPDPVREAAGRDRSRPRSARAKHWHAPVPNSRTADCHAGP